MTINPTPVQMVTRKKERKWISLDSPQNCMVGVDFMARSWKSALTICALKH